MSRSTKLVSTKPQAMLHGKCPQCRSGNMFSHSSFSKHFMEMNSHCEVCGLQYEIEPGFFWGAMYVSYAITCAILIILGGAVLVIGNNPDFWWYMGIILPVFVIASPFTYRYSRVMMLYWFSPIRFNRDLAKN